jgi:hypothetical protein
MVAKYVILVRRSIFLIIPIARTFSLIRPDNSHFRCANRWSAKVIGPGSDVRAFHFTHAPAWLLLLRINLVDQDLPTQVGNGQEIKVLPEMNELQDFENGNGSRKSGMGQNGASERG